MAAERRLPLVGQGRLAVAPPASLGERAPARVRLVAVVPAAPGVDVSPFAEALTAAARERSLRVTADPDDAEADLVVAVGEEAPARLVPHLLVIISGGLPRPSWSPVPRALASEADLVLADPREPVARALGEML